MLAGAEADELIGRHRHLDAGRRDQPRRSRLAAARARSVAGVDGCPGGWVVVTVAPDDHDPVDVVRRPDLLAARRTDRRRAADGRRHRHPDRPGAAGPAARATSKPGGGSAGAPQLGLPGSRAGGPRAPRTYEEACAISRATLRQGDLASSCSTSSPRSGRSTRSMTPLRQQRLVRDVPGAEPGGARRAHRCPNQAAPRRARRADAGPRHRLRLRDDRAPLEAAACRRPARRRARRVRGAWTARRYAAASTCNSVATWTSAACGWRSWPEPDLATIIRRVAAPRHEGSPLAGPAEIEELRHPHEAHDAAADRRHVLAVRVRHHLGVGELVLLAPGDEADGAVGQRVAHPLRVRAVGQGEAEPVLRAEHVDRRAVDGAGPPAHVDHDAQPGQPTRPRGRRPCS